MNTPTHLLSGMVLAQGALALLEARRSAPLPTGTKLVLAGAIIPLGALLHLLLDALPHWFWVGHVGGPVGIRFEWFLRAAAAGSMALIPFWLYGRRDWALTLAGAAGAMFPDLEKAAYFLGRWSAHLVVFPHHSMQVSNHTGGLPLWSLVTMELLLLTVLVGALRGLHRHRAGV